MTAAPKHKHTMLSDPDKLDSIHEQLDEKRSPMPDNRRASERYQYRHQKLVVNIQQPGDSAPTAYSVEPRDLSQGGLAFLHGGFIHLGSVCTTQLITLHGTWNDIRGAVVNCQYAADGIHEVHVEFREPIEPALYCSHAIRSRVLLVEDSPTIARLTQHFLRNDGADVDHAENGRVALEKTKDNVYDLILMDIEMPEMDGLTATKKIRARGYSGRIVAITGMTQPGDREKCLDAGCDDFIAKPITQEVMAGALKNVQQEPLYSSFAGDHAMADIIHEFVTDVPARIRAIEQALTEENIEQLKSLTRSLKAEGTSYGFEILSEISAKVESALIEEKPLSDCRAQINELLELCQQVRRTS